jgi:hypothetical protein
MVLSVISSKSISTNNRNKVMSFARTMKQNVAVLKRYTDAPAQAQIQIARLLYRLGKRRMAWQFLMAALWTDPTKFFGTSRAAWALKRRMAWAGAPPPAAFGPRETGVRCP